MRQSSDRKSLVVKKNSYMAGAGQSNVVKEYDMMRIIAILFVIIGHSAYLNMSGAWGGVDYSSALSLGEITGTKSYAFLAKIVGYVYYFHMPLFFCISGAVFHIDYAQKKKYTNIEELVINKSKRLLLPFLLFGTLWMVPIKTISHFYSYKNVARALLGVFLGQETGHLWFLWTLFWIFIIAFILVKFVFEKNVICGMASLLIVFLFQNQLNIALPGFVSGGWYLLFFFAGYGFDSVREKYCGLNRKWRGVLILSGMLLSYLSFKLTGTVDTTNKPLLNALKMLGVCSIIFLFYNAALLAGFRTNRGGRLFNGLNRHSFHIYLLHDPLNYLVLFLCNSFLWGRIENIEIFAITQALLRTVGIFLACLAISVLLKNVLSRWRAVKYALLPILVISAGVVSYQSITGKESNAEIYTSWHVDVKAQFQAVDLSDDKWAKGINSESAVILLKYDGQLLNSLLESTYLISGSVRKEIEEVAAYDDTWIWIKCADNESLESFMFPAGITAYTY